MKGLQQPMSASTLLSFFCSLQISMAIDRVKYLADVRETKVKNTISAINFDSSIRLQPHLNGLIIWHWLRSNSNLSLSRAFRWRLLFSATEKKTGLRARYFNLTNVFFDLILFPSNSVMKCSSSQSCVMLFIFSSILIRVFLVTRTENVETRAFLISIHFKQLIRRTREWREKITYPRKKNRFFFNSSSSSIRSFSIWNIEK